MYCKNEDTLVKRMLSE